MAEPSKPDISILLVARGEPTTAIVLESIDKQTTPPCEVILVETSGETSRSLPAGGLGVRLIRAEMATGLLEARSRAILAAKGDYSLLLDSTRPLREDCLERLGLLSREYEMVIVREGSIARSLWARVAELDRQLAMTESNVSLAAQGIAAFAIPRFFKTGLLQRAAARLQRNLGRQVFRKVRHGDHQLLFAECLKESKSVGIADWPLIFHYEDANPFETLRKYFGYGLSHAWIRRFPEYGSVGSLRSYFKSVEGLSFSQLAGVFSLYAARGFAFVTGLTIALVRNESYHWLDSTA